MRVWQGICGGIARGAFILADSCNIIEFEFNHHAGGPESAIREVLLVGESKSDKS